jgi:prepilin-type N-terminal cleavage/methylation domain-containing protein
MKFYLTKNNEHNQGFTLIELLIALAIIGILAGVIISAATAVGRNTRDAKRLSDLRSIQSSLQQYYADQNYYPLVGTSGTGVLDLSDDTLTNPTGTITYTTTLPKDPSSSGPYIYVPLTTSGLTTCDNTAANLCLKYCLYSHFEFQKPITNQQCNNSTPPKPARGDYNLQLTQP